MIRHRPFGSGHPYSDDTEQRSPIHPIEGTPLRLGVRTSADIQSVQIEFCIDEADSQTAVAHPVVRSSRGQSQDGGHLASAQARKARQAGGWQVFLDTPRAGSTLTYRFIAEKKGATPQKTRWFSTRIAAWRPAPDTSIEMVGDTTDGIVPGHIEVLDDGHRAHSIRFTLPLAKGEKVAGFGERYHALEHRGTTLDSIVFEQYKSQGEHRKTYLPMPFAHVVGGRGWGFHVRSSRRVFFDIGQTRPGYLCVEALIDSPSDNKKMLEVALYAGAPREVLDAFLEETGRPKVMPDWVFGLWASGNEWNTQAEVERQMALHKEHRIPVKNLVIEAWSDEKSFTIFRDARYEPRKDGGPMRLADFEFPAHGAWPDPKGMVDKLHAQGVRVHLWQIPLIKMRPHPTGQAAIDARTAIDKNLLVREVAPDGSLRPYRNRGWWFPLSLMPDLRDESAAHWWTEKRRYLVEELGIDGFKTDGGEHAWGSDLVYLDEMRGDEGNNLFPVAYAAAYGRLLESCGKAPVTFSRAGFTGSQAHGAFWAGDENSTWEAFRWSMFAGLSASSCGIVYWGWDIAGFSGPIPDAELYVRAMAASVFLPIMQYHSEFNHHRKPSVDRTPWNIAERTGDSEVIGQVRKLVELRERLIPYLVVSARDCVATANPLMRPLYFDYPHDEQLWKYPLQWLLGDHVLVCPVLQPAVDSWDVYLPAAEWVNAWTKEHVHGGQLVNVDVETRTQIPVFVKAEQWESLAAIFTRD